MTSPTFGTISEAIQIFRDSLIVLIPFIERIGMKWRTPDNYDDWDDIACAAYNSIIARTIYYTLEGEPFFKFTRYGLAPRTFREFSYLFCTHLGRSSPFIGLETLREPFDTAV